LKAAELKDFVRDTSANGTATIVAATAAHLRSIRIWALATALGAIVSVGGNWR